MKVSSVVVQACSECGTRRIGAFRYCRSCGYDFEPAKRAVPRTATSPFTLDLSRANAHQSVIPSPPGDAGDLDAFGSAMPVAVGPGGPPTSAATPSAPARGWLSTSSLAPRPSEPVAPAAAQAAPRPHRYRLASSHIARGVEPTDRRTVLLGVVIGALSGLAVVILMGLVSGSL